MHLLALSTLLFRQILKINCFKINHLKFYSNKLTDSTKSVSSVKDRGIKQKSHNKHKILIFNNLMTTF